MKELGSWGLIGIIEPRREECFGTGLMIGSFLAILYSVVYMARGKVFPRQFYWILPVGFLTSVFLQFIGSIFEPPVDWVRTSLGVLISSYLIVTSARFEVNRYSVSGDEEYKNEKRARKWIFRATDVLILVIVFLAMGRSVLSRPFALAEGNPLVIIVGEKRINAWMLTSDEHHIAVTRRIDGQRRVQVFKVEDIKLLEPITKRSRATVDPPKDTLRY